MEVNKNKINKTYLIIERLEILSSSLCEAVLPLRCKYWHLAVRKALWKLKKKSSQDSPNRKKLGLSEQKQHRKLHHEISTHFIRLKNFITWNYCLL